MTPEEMKNASRGYSTDMSPEALHKRLRIMSDLSSFTRWLATSVPAGRVESKPRQERAEEGDHGKAADPTLRIP